MNNQMQFFYNTDQYNKDLTSNKFIITCYLIDKCNYNCEYCCNIFPRTNTVLNLDKLLKFCVNYYVLYNKHIELRFIGGEPTLHPDLVEFCEKIKDKQFITCMLVTNFSKDIDYYIYLSTICKCEIGISWHSLHNNKQNIEFIYKLLSINKDIILKQFSILIMYEPNLYLNTLQLFNKIKQIYPNNVKLVYITNQNKNSKFSYTNSQYTLYKHAIKNEINAHKLCHIYAYKTDNKVQYKNITQFYEPVLKFNYQFKNYKCNAGKDEIFIFSNGDISNCMDLYFSRNIIIGNINNYYQLKNYNKSTICPLNICGNPYLSIKQKI